MARTHSELHAPLAVLPDEGGDNRAIAQQCLENIEQNWFTFSRVMFRIYRNEEFKEWGYSSFKDYVEGELAFKYKSAMWRVQIGEAVEQFGITAEEVAGMGWTKFGFITPKIHKDMKKKDFLALIEKAKKMTAREIKDFVSSPDNQTEVINRRENMTFTFTNESIDTVKAALEEAMKLANTKSPTVGFEYISTEWLMDHNPKKAEEIQSKLHPEPVKTEKPRKERLDVRKKAASKETKEEPKVEKKAAKKPTKKAAKK
jgi:hypothetical protein